MWHKIHSLSHKKNRAGFTLLEMLVVFSVIGILTGVGFASFVSYSKKQTLDQAVLDLKTGIDYAKFNAVSRVKPSVSLCSGPVDRYILKVCTSAVSCVNSSNLYETYAGCILGGISQPTSVISSKTRSATITSTILCSGSNNYLQFHLLSGIDEPCKIVVTDGSASKTICVDAGGSASILDGSIQCPSGL